MESSSVVVAPQRDYSELPLGIPRKIALEHLQTLEDVENFRQVCSVWNSETNDIDHTNFRPSSNTQLPWLMLADSASSSYRRFYSLTKRTFLKVDLPKEFHKDGDRRRYFSSKGWLIAVSRNHGLITLFDLFSANGGTVITPPSMPFDLIHFVNGDGWDKKCYYYQVSRFIFSSSPPTTTNRNNGNNDHTSDDTTLQVAMIFNFTRDIAFWRPGQQHWIKPVASIHQIEDVCYFKGVFYIIDHYVRVIALENPSSPRIVVNLVSQGLINQWGTMHYIVPLGEQQPASLLVVSRIVEISDDLRSHWTTLFHLFEVDIENKTATRVGDIGNRALFVGHTSTFFVEASASLPSSHGCRPNCIYFTDDYTSFFSSRGGGADMGIYSLDENKVVDRVYEGPSQFSYETPPLWVELPHH